MLGDLNPAAGEGEAPLIPLAKFSLLCRMADGVDFALLADALPAAALVGVWVELNESDVGNGAAEEKEGLDEVVVEAMVCLVPRAL